MKPVAAAIAQFDQAQIAAIEKDGKITLDVDGGAEVLLEEVEITTQDIPGLLVANEGKYTVALDINLTDELKQEGIARELVNRIQNLRKEKEFDLTDNILLTIKKTDEINKAVENHKKYICSETLATELLLVEKMINEDNLEVELDENISTIIAIVKN